MDTIRPVSRIVAGVTHAKHAAVLSMEALVNTGYQVALLSNMTLNSKWISESALCRGWPGYTLVVGISRPHEGVGWSHSLS